MPPAVSVCSEEGDENGQLTVADLHNSACSSISGQDDSVAASAGSPSSPSTPCNYASITSDIASGCGVGDGEASSQAVRLLDDELMELEKLIYLQQRKVEALQRLREQYLAGQRYGAVQERSSEQLESRTVVGLMCVLCRTQLRIRGNNMRR